MKNGILDLIMAMLLLLTISLQNVATIVGITGTVIIVIIRILEYRLKLKNKKK